MAARTGFDYNRVLVLRTGLDQIAPGQYVCHTVERFDKASAKLLREKAVDFDIVYVPPFRHRDVGFVKKNTLGLPLVFDPLIGNYITRVVDYGWWWRKPFARRRDKKFFGYADHLIFDTEAHKRWSVSTLGFDESRCHTLYIGADTDLFPDLSGNQSAFERQRSLPIKVGFYGSLVPLQGVDIILKAAHLLHDRIDIKFEFIGDFSNRPDLIRLRDSLLPMRAEFIPYLDYDELSMRLRDFDICLGIFGASEKANVVIPNKVYHYAALGKPIITRAADGIAEVFQSGQDLITIDPSPQHLASAIVKLADDAGLRQNLGQSAAHRVRNRFTAPHIAQDFLDILTRVL